MNKKENIMNMVISIVLECTAYERADGSASVTREDILSPERKGENVGMIRCILCHMLIMLGFTKESIADLLSRKVDTINDILMRGLVYEQTNFIYRVAYSQTEDKCRALMREIQGEK